MVEQILDASRRRTSFPASPDGSLKDCRSRPTLPCVGELLVTGARDACQTRVGLTSESLASSPLTKVGESSVDSEVANATASEIATTSGTVSL